MQIHKRDYIFIVLILLLLIFSIVTYKQKDLCLENSDRNYKINDIKYSKLTSELYDLSFSQSGYYISKSVTIAAPFYSEPLIIRIKNNFEEEKEFEVDIQPNNEINPYVSYNDLKVLKPEVMKFRIMPGAQQGLNIVIRPTKEITKTTKAFPEYIVTIKADNEIITSKKVPIWIGATKQEE